MANNITFSYLFNKFKMYIPNNFMINPNDEYTIAAMNALTWISLKHYEQMNKTTTIENIHINSTKIRRMFNIYHDSSYIVTSDIENTYNSTYVSSKLINNKLIRKKNINITLDISTDTNEQIGYCIQNVDVILNNR